MGRRTGISVIIAAIILVMIAVAGGIVIYAVVYNYMQSSGKTSAFSIENMFLYSEYTGDRSVFAATLKNVGTVPIVRFEVTVSGENKAQIDLSDTPLQPGYTTAITPQLHAKYFPATAYSVTIVAVYSDGGTSGRTFSITCQSVAQTLP
jgi:hypothetical protein